MDQEQIAAEVDLAWYLHTHGGRAGRFRRLLLPVLAERQNWRCCYCGIRMDGVGTAADAPTVEHVIPRSKGGTDASSNLVAACRRCNGKRASDYRPEHREALAHVRKRPSKWPQESTP